ncbi:hypothetical protein ACVWZ4_007221 [Bradyrhizobium sp. USDA 4472]
MAELSQCPFCGGKPLRLCGPTSWIECSDCVAKTSQCATIEKAEELWGRRIDPAGEINRLRERLGPRGLEVVDIDGAGHYVNAKVKTEIERLRKHRDILAMSLRLATQDQSAAILAILKKHIKLDWLNASDGHPEIVGLDEAAVAISHLSHVQQGDRNGS